MCGKQTSELHLQTPMCLGFNSICMAPCSSTTEVNEPNVTSLSHFISLLCWGLKYLNRLWIFYINMPCIYSTCWCLEETGVFFLLMKRLWRSLADHNDVNGAADVSLGVQSRRAAGWTAVSDRLHMRIRPACLNLLQTCTAFYLWFCFVFFLRFSLPENQSNLFACFLNREISFRIWLYVRLYVGSLFVWRLFDEWG